MSIPTREELDCMRKEIASAQRRYVRALRLYKKAQREKRAGENTQQ